MPPVCSNIVRCLGVCSLAPGCEGIVGLAGTPGASSGTYAMLIEYCEVRTRGRTYNHMIAAVSPNTTLQREAVCACLCLQLRLHLGLGLRRRMCMRTCNYILVLRRRLGLARRYAMIIDCLCPFSRFYLCRCFEHATLLGYFGRHSCTSCRADWPWTIQPRSALNWLSVCAGSILCHALLLHCGHLQLRAPSTCSCCAPTCPVTSRLCREGR